MSAIKENPLLFGCLGILGFLSLLACSGAVAMYFLADEIAEKGKQALEEMGEEMGREAGLKDPMNLFTEMMSQGWTLNVNVSGDDRLELTVIPADGREVDCASLQELVFPHLVGTKETVVVRSQNRVEVGPGTVTTTDVECTWSGYPGRDEVMAEPVEAPDAPEPPADGSAPAPSGEDDAPASPALEDGE